MNENENREISPVDEGPSALTGIGYQLRKGLDRVGFEADKLMRVNRIRGEVARLHKQVDQLKDNISERVLELEAEGAEMEPSIKALVTEIRAIRKQLAEKSAEIEAIGREAWVEPPPPVAPAPPRRLPSGAAPRNRPVAETPRRASVEQAASPPASRSPEVCPNCGGPLRPMSVFCPNCGHKL